MQFIRTGPEVPERLLQAHEDGRVVFFCGAGISYPAGLPGFEVLTQKLYENTEAPTPEQKRALDAKQFDTAIHLLEAAQVGGRQSVRKRLAEVLTAKASVLETREATATHEALLILSKSKEGATRLATTNFDRLFAHVIAKDLGSAGIRTFEAPLLPIPNGRWDGLVYLHGLLPEAPAPADLNRLVVSSGDFGLAYLVERWAARFVSELLRTYHVCFVGYSLDDPVLRYMADALGATRLLGEPVLEMFAFAGHATSKESEAKGQWEAKNVVPILYIDEDGHTYLHQTLRAWAHAYRDGTRGKERIVEELGRALPSASTEEDNFVGRLLWALSDPSGLPAKRFAELSPAPPLEWLDEFCKERYGHSDLAAFGVPPRSQADATLKYSFARRPAAYDMTPMMSLARSHDGYNRRDPVMREIERWLLRYLDDPKLLAWLSTGGGRIDRWFVRDVEERLQKIGEWERAEDHGALAALREASPMATPRRALRKLWDIACRGGLRHKEVDHDVALHRWIRGCQRFGLTATARVQLRELLSPRVSLRERTRGLFWASEPHIAEAPERLDNLLECEISPVARHVHSYKSEIVSVLQSDNALPAFLPDFTNLLRDTLDMMRDIEMLDDRHDGSHYLGNRPSISEHGQNSDFNDWTALIDLILAAWRATATVSQADALRAAEEWWRIPYPLFKRLALFAAAQDGGVVPVGQGLTWLLANDGWWLWANETRREVMRLLIALAPRLAVDEFAELEQAILAGPPRDLFKDDLAPEDWHLIRDEDIWLRLAKVALGGPLGSAGRRRLTHLESEHPEWRLAPDERDEFLAWIGERAEPRRAGPVPGTSAEWTAWLQGNHQGYGPWRELCRAAPEDALQYLGAVASDKVWPANPWVDALYAFSEADVDLLARSWTAASAIRFDAFPAEWIAETARALSTWLEKVAALPEDDDSKFLHLCELVLRGEYDSARASDARRDPVTAAINQPVGQVTDALIRRWQAGDLLDGQSIPHSFKEKFTRLCDVSNAAFCHGRVLLAAHVTTLYRVDPEWTSVSLLPLFDWNSSAEARAVWMAFLWPGRLDPAFAEVVRDAFLDTAAHYEKLDRHADQYARLLTLEALRLGTTVAAGKLRAATRQLPGQGLQVAAGTLCRVLDSAGDKAVQQWNHSVRPYLETIWPQELSARTPAVSEQLAKVCVAAGPAFPDALQLLGPWLQRVPFPAHIIKLLRGKELCVRFPAEALQLLDKVIAGEPPLDVDVLRSCLKDISTHGPALAEDHRFRRLDDICRAAE